VAPNHPARAGRRARRLLPAALGVVGLLAALVTAPPAAATPPAGAYADWLALHFPAAYPNPALEASVWGDFADPDGDGCPNLIEFITARDPNTPDRHLAPRCRIDGDDLVITYRESTATGHGVALLGEWSVDAAFWVQAGVRYEPLESHADHRLIEARISRNRETKMWFRLSASR